MDKDQTKIDHDALLLERISTQDFLAVGLDQVAYIRPVEMDDKGLETFAIHAADGSQLSIMDTYDTAVAAVVMNDLHPVTLH